MYLFFKNQPIDSTQLKNSMGGRTSSTITPIERLTYELYYN